jgi:hypothetical protein
MVEWSKRNDVVPHRTSDPHVAGSNPVLVTILHLAINNVDTDEPSPINSVSEAIAALGPDSED